MIKKMNDKQKWAIVILVGCIVTLLTAYTESHWVHMIEVRQWANGDPISHGGWIGCLLVGASFSSITGFFLFKDK
tara:strand:+ start:253 stop:477 length:225 start_codon:yes stop_codon:yes gene_type:complete